MKTLFSFAASALFSVGACVSALATDPFADLTCPNPTDAPTFCGPNKAADTCDPVGNPDACGCFKRVTLLGCQLMYGASSTKCNWGYIYGAIKITPASIVCLNQLDWCNDPTKGKGDKDFCQKDYNNCITDNNDFKSECK